MPVLPACVLMPIDPPTIGPLIVSVCPAAASTDVVVDGVLIEYGRDAGDVKLALASSEPPLRLICGSRVTVNAAPLTAGLNAGDVCIDVALVMFCTVTVCPDAV